MYTTLLKVTTDMVKKSQFVIESISKSFCLKRNHDRPDWTLHLEIGVANITAGIAKKIVSDEVSASSGALERS